VNLPAYLIGRLQSVLDATARPIFHLDAPHCITYAHVRLHWWLYESERTK